MRILFSPYPSRSHFFPVVPFAWALQSAGHEVRVSTPAFFADTIAATGLTPVSLGDPSLPEVRARDDAKPPAGPAETMAYVDAMGLDPVERELWIVFFQYMMVPLSDYLRLDLPDAPDLVSFAQVWKPDLILWDPCFPAGAVAARTCGAAHGRFLGPSLDWYAHCSELVETHRSQIRAAGLAESPIGDRVRPLAERYRVEVDDELVFGQWTVDLLPVGLSLTNSKLRIPARWVPYNGGETFQPWLYERPARPRVALSLGESTRRYVAGDWGRTAKLFEAVAGLDIELVATLNKVQLGEVSHIPGNVRTIDWVSLTQLMPTCSALIHHGGNGTFSAATAMKVPQLVWDTDLSLLLNPATADDEGVYRTGREFGVREDAEAESRTDWVHPAKNLQATPCADYLTAHGAGARINHLTQTTEEIGQVVQRVLTEPSFQDGVASIYRNWLATPSPTDLVSVLEGLTAEYRRTP